MPAISNLNKAHKQINEQASKILEGEYTLDVAVGFLDSAVKEFNLNEDKANELKAMDFNRELDVTVEDNEEPVELTLEEIVQEQAEQIKNLTACLSEIATLAGYANYLGKYGLKRTEP